MLRYLRGRVVTHRVALLLILAAGLWLGWRVDWVRRQERAVAAIREVGGTVVFDYHDAEGTEAPGVLARAFAAVREWIGDAVFRDFVFVNNRLEGNAPSTIDAVVERIVH
jgi:hypothetical protein